MGVLSLPLPPVFLAGSNIGLSGFKLSSSTPPLPFPPPSFIYFILFFETKFLCETALAVPELSL